MTLTPQSLLLGAALVGLLGGCASSQQYVPLAVQNTSTPLDYHQIDVRRQTEIIEIAMEPGFSQLRREEVSAMEAFVFAYRQRGHGPLMMIMPENAADQELVVESVRVARELAFRNGVAWENIQGRNYDAHGQFAPLVLTFESYEAVAPDCLSLAAYDLSDITSNNEPAYFGCAIEHNIAAMLADPGDLLGQRQLDPRDARRVSLIMEAYRDGGATGAAGNGEAVSVGG